MTEMRDVKWQTSNVRRETIDGKREVSDVKREAGKGRPVTGNVKPHMGDVRREAANVSETLDSHFIRQSRFGAFFLFLFFLVPAILFAQNIPDQPSGHVNDYANILSSSEQQRLETKLRNYRDTTTTVIAVATINSLEGRDVQQVGTELFNRWNIWQGDKNNGVLILIAKEERRMRIDVGYGLEGAIPDVMAARIIRNVLNPSFKQGDFYGGLDRATTILIQLARGEFTGNLEQQSTGSGEDDWISVIIFFLFVAYMVYATSRKGGGKNGGRRTFGPGGFIWLGGGGFGGGSGGGFGGGGGGFGGFSGGGGFGAGGGGASGGW